MENSGEREGWRDDRSPSPMEHEGVERPPDGPEVEEELTRNFGGFRGRSANPRSTWSPRDGGRLGGLTISGDARRGPRSRDEVRRRLDRQAWRQASIAGKENIDPEGREESGGGESPPRNRGE